jgi:hypothetical protein
VGLTLVREDRVGRTSSVRVIAPAVALGSYVRKGETLKASKRETLHKMRSPWMATSLKAPGRRPGR